MGGALRACHAYDVVGSWSGGLPGWTRLSLHLTSANRQAIVPADCFRVPFTRGRPARLQRSVTEAGDARPFLGHPWLDRHAWSLHAPLWRQHLLRGGLDRRRHTSDLRLWDGGAGTRLGASADGAGPGSPLHHPHAHRPHPGAALLRPLPPTREPPDDLRSGRRRPLIPARHERSNGLRLLPRPDRRLPIARRLRGAWRG